MFRKKKNSYLEYEQYKIGNLFKPSLDDNLVPQGICYIDPYVFISCYTTNDQNSRVLMYGKTGTLLRTIILDHKSHVGGISYDQLHHLIFICDSKGKVSSYLYQEFIKGNLQNKKNYLVADNSLGGSFLKEDEKVVCSYLTCFEGKLYVGSFCKKSNGLVKVFEIVSHINGVSLKYLTEFIVPKKIQGITFYRKDNQTYMFLSQSYTRVKDSQILGYKYICNQNDYSNNNFSFSLPPMLEQIYIMPTGKMLLLFESFAKKYSYNAKIVVDDIVLLDSLKMIDSFININRKGKI